MSKHIRNILFFAIIVFTFSCKKKTPENIGLPLLPGEDLLNALFTDSLTLISHTVKDDSLPTKNVLPILLGNLLDPIFGVTKSSLFTQFSLSKANPNFGTNPVLDSVVLSLVYNVSGLNIQYYGNLTPQKFDVYELSEALDKNSTYYSNKLLLFRIKIGSAVITPRAKADSVAVDTLKFPAHLRIKLNTGMFQSFLDSTSSYNSHSSFQNVFKGIYIVSSTMPSSRQGAILYMNLADVYSRLTLYYHNASDTTSYYFGTRTECTRYSYFEHDYSMTTDIQQQLNSASNIQSDKVFVQPMAGVRTKITMPYINDFFKNQKVAINKAELILPVDPNSFSGNDSAYSPSAKLVATIADSAKGPLVMPDYFEGATYFGGDYDAVNKVYKFNIARYVQQVLNGTIKNQGLYIITNARPTTANRVQLVGGNKTLSNRMRLKITYTPLK